MIWLSIIKRFWWAIPLLGLLAALGISRADIRHLRTKNADLVATLARYERISAENVQKANHDKETADAAYQSATKAAVLLGDDLARRVRYYEDRLRAGAVQDPGEPTEATGGDPLPEAVGLAIAACTRDAARLQNAYDWASSVDHEAGPASNP